MNRERFNIAVAVLLLVAAAAASILWGRAAAVDARTVLGRAVVTAGERTFAGRLAAPFPHVPLRRPVRGAAEASVVPRLQLHAAVAAALAKVHAGDPVAIRDGAIAALLAGNAVHAADQLNALARRTDDPAIWTDAAAAAVAACDATADLRRCVDAIAASDRAVRRGVVAARFNRGLALERLGLTREAFAEWSIAAREERDAGWQAEAAMHAERLRSTRKTWKSQGPELQAAVAAGDARTIRRIVQTFPRDARAWGETVAPANWADAIAANDAGSAARELVVMRRIGEALRDLSGERLLSDAVAVIDTVLRDGDAARLRTLAAAYRAYRAGRIDHSSLRSIEAEARFSEAEGLFAQTGSPMQYVARFYVGSARYNRQDLVGVEAILEPLEARRFTNQGYHALAAQIGWELGLARLLRGKYTSALTTFEQSAQGFARLHEDDKRAGIDDFLADTYELLGRPTDAWAKRKEALEVFSRVGDVDRELAILWAAANAQIQMREWERAEALVDIAVAVATREHNAIRAAAALIQRGVTHAAQMRYERAKRDLADAARWERSVPENATTARLRADRFVAEALADAGDPDRAADALSRAISYYAKNGLDVFWAQALFERARVHRRRNDIVDARSDLDTAIRLLERQRESVANVAERALMFATVTDVFREAVDIALMAGDDTAAFTLAERSRGRSLLDLMRQRGLHLLRLETASLPLEAIQRELAADAAILEYVVLPDRLIAFVVTTDRLQAVSTPVSRADVQKVVADCVTSHQGNDPSRIRSACGRAADLLIAPVRLKLRGIATVAVISDGVVDGFPFAAAYLSSDAKFLGEEVAIVEAPSATIAIACSRRARATAPDRALVIGANAFDRGRFALPELPQVKDEVRRIAAIHNGIIVEGAEVTRERLQEEMARAGIIHFAGHARVNATRPAESLLLIASTRNVDDLSAADVAAMDLRARLVYLSTCRSGAAARLQDGLESIALALLAAGVPSVVATRWDLPDDAGVRIATNYHEAFSRTDDAAAALQAVVRTKSVHEVNEASGVMTIIGGTRRLVRAREER